MLTIACVLQPSLNRCSFLLLGLKGVISPLADEEARAQRGEMFCLKSPSISILDSSFPNSSSPFSMQQARVTPKYIQGSEETNR